MKLKALDQDEHFRSREGFVEGAHVLGGEMILDDTNLPHPWVSHCQRLHELGIVLLRPALVDLLEPLAGPSAV